MRNFNEVDHEGVVDNDVFFAVIHAMVCTLQRDGPLSATLPPLHQTS